MNENINLCEILRDCPRGAKFYSYIFGEDTHFMGVSPHQGDARPIFIYGKYGEGQNFCLTRKGHAYADNYGECCIFPSKDQRDWNKFTAPWYKQEKKETKRFDPNTLKEFDRVIVRKSYVLYWSCDLFSYNYIDFNGDNKSVCIGDNYCYCIPYNDDTKHLVGTKDEAPEFYRYWED